MSGPEDAARPYVRMRSTTDLAECAQLLRDVYAADGYPVEGVQDAYGWLMPPGLMEAWIAIDASRVVGHIALCEPMGDPAAAMLMEATGAQEHETAILARLFVAPSARGKSIARKLAITAAVYAVERHLLLAFQVRAADHHAVGLYESLGCERLGETWHAAGDSKILMHCYVAPATVPDDLRQLLTSDSSAPEHRNQRA